jgi:hypothetical protein
MSSVRVGTQTTGRPSRWAAVDPEHTGDLALRVVRHLVRCPDRERSVGAGSGGEAVRLHRRHGETLVDVAAADDDVGHRLEVERGIR